MKPLERVKHRLEKGLSDLDIPERMHGGVRRYVLDGILPGDFLYAVFANSLSQAAITADQENQQILWRYGGLIYDFLPSDCQGSFAKMVTWCERGGANEILREKEK